MLLSLLILLLLLLLLLLFIYMTYALSLGFKGVFFLEYVSFEPRVSLKQFRISLFSKHEADLIFFLSLCFLCRHLNLV